MLLTEINGGCMEWIKTESAITCLKFNGTETSPTFHKLPKKKICMKDEFVHFLIMKQLERHSQLLALPRSGTF